MTPAAVSPGNVSRSAVRCNRFRQLVRGGATACAMMAGIAPSQWTAPLIMGCRDMLADDGFVYNVCALALERALFHRMGLVRSLAAEVQRASARGAEDSIDERVKNILACHVEVLMRAAHHQETG